MTSPTSGELDRSLRVSGNEISGSGASGGYYGGYEGGGSRLQAADFNAFDEMDLDTGSGGGEGGGFLRSPSPHRKVRLFSFKLFRCSSHSFNSPTHYR